MTELATIISSTHDATVARTGNGIRAVSATTLDELVRIRPQWDQIRARLGRATPNSDPDRVMATISALGEGAAPHVVILEQGGEAVGLLVGRITTRRLQCRFGYWRPRTPALRCLDIVYGGLVHDHTDAALHAIHEQLLAMIGSRAVDHIMINRLSIDDALHDMFARSPRAVIESPVAHWRCELLDPETGEPRRIMSAKSRNTQRRHERKLAEAFDIELFVATEPGHVERFIREGARIGDQSYHAALGVGLRDDPMWRAIIARAAERGQLRSYILFGDGEPLSYVLGFVYDAVFFLEATGFRREFQEHSPGAVLLWKIMNDLREAGVRAIDFGFGDAEYKRRYGTESWMESTIGLYGAGARARLARAMDGSFRRASSIANHLAKSAGRVGALKRRWRLRLERKRADS